MKTTTNLKDTILKTIIFMVTMFVAVAAYGQRGEYQKITGGLVGGFNTSQIDGDTYKGYDHFGWTGGGIIYIPFLNMDLPMDGTMALSMEVLFSQKGARGNNRTLNILDERINLSYAEVPIQINYYRGTRRTNIGIGFCFGYMAKNEQLQDYAGTGLQLMNKYPYKKFDFSLVFTPNIHIYKGLYLSPRFQYSLLNIIKKNNSGYTQSFNNNLGVRLMYLFGKDYY